MFILLDALQQRNLLRFIIMDNYDCETNFKIQATGSLYSITGLR